MNKILSLLCILYSYYFYELTCDFLHSNVFHTNVCNDLPWRNWRTWSWQSHSMMNSWTIAINFGKMHGRIIDWRIRTRSSRNRSITLFIHSGHSPFSVSCHFLTLKNYLILSSYLCVEYSKFQIEQKKLTNLEILPFRPRSVSAPRLLLRFEPEFNPDLANVAAYLRCSAYAWNASSSSITSMEK